MIEWVGLPQNSIDAIWRESATLALVWDIATGKRNPWNPAKRQPLETMTDAELAERQEREIDIAQELYDLDCEIDMANLFRLHELERQHLAAERLYNLLMEKDFDAIRGLMDDADPGC